MLRADYLVPVGVNFAFVARSKDLSSRLGSTGSRMFSPRGPLRFKAVNPSFANVLREYVSHNIVD